MNKILSGAATFALLSIGAYYATSVYATLKNVKRNDTKAVIDVEGHRKYEEREKAKADAYIANQNAQQKWNEDSNQRDEIYLLHNMKKWNDEEE